MTRNEEKFFDFGLWAYRLFCKDYCLDLRAEDIEAYLQKHMLQRDETNAPSHSDGYEFPLPCWRLRKELVKVLRDNPEF